MFGTRGTSCVGTAAADAPPTSDMVNPAAPNAGTAFVPRLRFEACFARGIVASSIHSIAEMFSSPARRGAPTTLRPPRPGRTQRPETYQVLVVQVHERCVHKTCS